MITQWWDTLQVLDKILWGITLASSAIFIIQSLMTFMGAGQGDMDMDMGGDLPDDVSGADPGMNLYTFRNFVNFCLGFGWTAVLFRDRIDSMAALFALSFIVGVGLVTLVMYLFKWLATMQQSGNINVFTSAAGCQGTVYLTIPGERSGEGKVQISINGSIREYNAVTDEEPILTGTPIRVVEALDANTLVVSKINSLII